MLVVPRFFKYFRLLYFFIWLSVQPRPFFKKLMNHSRPPLLFCKCNFYKNHDKKSEFELNFIKYFPNFKKFQKIPSFLAFLA